MRHNASQRNTMHHNASQRNTKLCITTHCIATQRIALQNKALYRNASHCNTTHRNALTCIAAERIAFNATQRIATLGHAVQRNATQRNSTHRNATHHTAHHTEHDASQRNARPSLRTRTLASVPLGRARLADEGPRRPSEWRRWSTWPPLCSPTLGGVAPRGWRLGFIGSIHGDLRWAFHRWCRCRPLPSCVRTGEFSPCRRRRRRPWR